MGTPERRCGACVQYKRRHVGGPSGYGFCEKRNGPRHANERGCELWSRTLAPAPGPCIEDVLQCCPTCGPMLNAVILDGERFCPRCAARRLRESGVPTLEMRRVPRKG